MRGPRQRQESRYQRFVGAELAAVLEQVQRTHGSGASIVSVDRVRQGGVAGFFARETYEVLVDSSSPSTPSLPPASGATARSVRPNDLHGSAPAVLSFTDLLAQRIEEEERDELHQAMAGRLRPSGPAPSVIGDDDSWFDPHQPAPPFVPGPDPFDGPGASFAADSVGADALIDEDAIDEDVIDEEPVDDGRADDGRADDGLAYVDLVDDSPSTPRIASVDGWTTADRLLPQAGHQSMTRLLPQPDPSGRTFWGRYDLARREADLLVIPPVALSAVVGSLEVVGPVVRRLQENHWAGQCDVVALTSRRSQAGPGWRTVDRQDALADVVRSEQGDFPILVIDVPPLFPSWLRPLLDELREDGLGLVHYVLDGDPSDEDLATWHGEIGRPAVLDLLAPMNPTRALDLVDRGEPLASIGGVPMSADLLFALRTEVSCAR